MNEEKTNNMNNTPNEPNTQPNADTAGFSDPFLTGNERIEKAIDQYYANPGKETLSSILETIRQRMHEDGHFIFPVFVKEGEQGSFAFRTVQGKDGKLWNAAFTSQVEYEKGEPSRVLSFFIDRAMEFCLETGAEGFLINPWGRSFRLPRELMEVIFNADGGEEYAVPEEPITQELLEDGSYLKRAIGICNRNRTQLNVLKLFRILRDSSVWVPCNAILSDADYERWTGIVKDALENGGPDSIVGKEVVSKDQVLFVPDILKNGDSFFFPVFTSEEEMGDYGNDFSKVGSHFLEAANLARNNEKDVAGIVINAFSEPFVIPKEMFDMIAGMPSSLEAEENTDKKQEPQS